MKCKCVECGITKNKFVSNQSGSGILDGLLKGGVKGGPYRVDFKKGFQSSDPGLFKFPRSKEKEHIDAKRRVKGFREEYKEYKRKGGRNLLVNGQLIRVMR